MRPDVDTPARQATRTECRMAALMSDQLRPLSTPEHEHLSAMIDGAGARSDPWAAAHWRAEYVSRQTYYAEHERLVAPLAALLVEEMPADPPAPSRSPDERHGSGICMTGVCIEPCGPNGGCVR